jgi:hypothetical protein
MRALTDLKPMHYAAMMTLMFILSFGMLWRKRDEGDQTVMARSAAPTAPMPPTPVSPQSRPAPAPAPAVPQPQDVRRAEMRRPSQEDWDADQEGEEIPVVFGIIRKVSLFRDRTTNFESVRREVNEGIVSADPGKTLTVTVIETDMQTQEAMRTTFELAKGAQRHFGAQDGLNMASGDQLRLHSPPYLDLVRTIP